MLKCIFDRLNTTDRRTSLIRKNILASSVVKGWSALVQFLLVPITLKCLGDYGNGVWLTISSMLLWIDNLDIGLGNGLRNKLAEHLAHNDIVKAREAVSSTFFMLSAIMIPFVVISLALVAFTDTYSFLNVDSNKISDLNPTLFIAVILIGTTFVFKFIGNFFMGLQLVAVSNLLVALGHTLALIGTLFIYLFGIKSLFNVAIVNIIAPLLVYLISYPIVFFSKYSYLRPSVRYIKCNSIGELFNTSIKFFVLQISAVILFMTSNLIISKIFNPEYVTPFQIAYRYFTVILLVFGVIGVPYWSATTDAYQRKDFEWIRRANRSLNRMMMLIGIILVLMIVSAPWVFRIWIGNDYSMPMSYVVLVAVYIAILVTSARYSYILNGIGCLRLQLITTSISTILYIPLAFFIGSLWHQLEALLITMCVINLPMLISNILQYHKVIDQRAGGIWIK